MAAMKKADIVFPLYFTFLTCCVKQEVGIVGEIVVVKWCDAIRWCE